MFAYTMSWYVVAFLEAIIVLVLTTSLVYALQVFKTTSVTLFMTAFLLYIVSYIPLAQVYSLFFIEPKNAGKNTRMLIYSHFLKSTT